MKMSKMSRATISFFMAFLLSNIPALAASESSPVQQQPANSMLSTMSVVEEMDRTRSEKEINDYLSKPQVQAELSKHGISSEEASQRLASLSDSELRRLSMDVQQARVGGDILVTILLVVLIIYIVKRI